MTREQAEVLCKRLATEHPDRDSHRWVPQEAGDGNWKVAQISLPPRDDAGTTAEIRAEKRPPPPDDTRPLRDIGGPWVGPA